MRISILQSPLVWENKAANLAQFSEKLVSLAGQTDLVVLPEMFTTGFSMNAETLAEPMNGPTLAWFRAQAAQLGAVVTGSFMCEEQGKFFNRLVWMQPDGQFFCYDKRHLFRLAGEDAHFSPGQAQLTVEWKGFRVRPMICYDLRFPVWARNTDAYDVLLFVANWPIRRAHHWKSLLTARAIENQAYCIGVNICGTDGMGLEYSGDSTLVDFAGNTVFQVSGQAGIFSGQLDKAALDKYRAQLAFLNDKDEFTWI